MAIREHLEELKEHLDSSVFLAMELHGERPNPQHVSKWPVFVFLLSAAICLLNSTVFHLFHPMSSSTPPPTQRHTECCCGSISQGSAC